MGGWARQKMNISRGERKVGWDGLGVEIGEGIRGRNEGFQDMETWDELGADVGRTEI